MEAATREANGGTFRRALPEVAAIHVPIAEFADQFVNGLTLGMLYILVALGLNIILGLMGVINFSHGAFFMLGAYLMYQLDGPLGFWPAILASAILVCILGVLFVSSLIRPLCRYVSEYTLLLTY